MPPTQEIVELQEALAKIEGLAHVAKVMHEEESLVGALNDIADITEEFLDDGDEAGDGNEEEEDEEEEP